jgi:sterol desaturase/sphingolipid hydroxylase (fatty acid hydroxylase superfamily)
LLSITTSLIFPSKRLIEESRLGCCLKSYKEHIADCHRSTHRDKTHEKYAYIMIRKGQPMTDLLYARSKVRILGASIINIPMITLAAMFCMWTYFKILVRWMNISLMVTFLNGVVLTFLFSWLYVYNEVLHQNRLERFYEATKLKNNDDDISV